MLRVQLPLLLLIVLLYSQGAAPCAYRPGSWYLFSSAEDPGPGPVGGLRWVEDGAPSLVDAWGDRELKAILVDEAGVEYTLLLEEEP